MSKASNQPPFNPLEELSEDSSGITHRANERLKKWMEYHNEAYERENCPVGGCDGPSCSSLGCDGTESVLPQRSNEIKSWGDCIVWEKSKDYMAECKIDWNLVRERMNVWVSETQNPECHNVFYNYNECVCEALAKEDCPPRVYHHLIKYHNLGEGWHGFSYPKDNDDHIGEINRLLLDATWEWLIDKDDIGLQHLEFGRTKEYKRGVLEPCEGDVYVKFKVLEI